MTSYSKLTFRVNLTPAQELTPNRALKRSGHYGHVEASAGTRYDVGQVIQSAIRAKAIETPVFSGPIEVFVRVWWGKYWAVGERRANYQYRSTIDNDALISALKPTYDALQDAGVVQNDRQIESYRVKQFKDPDESGYMLISILALSGLDVPNCPVCNGDRDPARCGETLIGLWCATCRNLSPASTKSG